MKVTDTTNSNLSRLSKSYQDQKVYEEHKKTTGEFTETLVKREDSVTISFKSNVASKVEKLKLEVANGTYKLDPSLIAEKMLSQEIEL